MNKFIPLIISSFLYAFPSKAYVRGVDRADKIIKIKVSDSAIQRCFVFRNFIVVEVDSFQQGAEKIAIRELTKSVTPKIACSSRTLVGEVILDIKNENVYGARGDFLMTENADGFGKSYGINIYSKKSSKALKRLTYHNEKDLIVTDLKDSLSIEFYMELKLSCTFATKDPSCWERIKKENKIPTDIVEKPKCEEVYSGNAFKSSPELKKKPGAVQVFALVKIPNVKSDEIQFMKGEATCDATP